VTYNNYFLTFSISHQFIKWISKMKSLNLVCLLFCVFKPKTNLNFPINYKQLLLQKLLKITLLAYKTRKTFSPPQISLVRISQANLRVKLESPKNRKKNTPRTIEWGTKSMSEISKSQIINFKKKLKSWI